MRKIFMMMATAIALTTSLKAQEAKKPEPEMSWKTPSGILHPEMTVAKDAGSYEKPAGTLGAKPEHEWSATTDAAGVGGKPNPGKVVSVTGEIVDLSCYLQLGKHGEKHLA